MRLNERLAFMLKPRFHVPTRWPPRECESGGFTKLMVGHWQLKLTWPEMKELTYRYLVLVFILFESIKTASN